MKPRLKISRNQKRDGAEGESDDDEDDEEMTEEEKDRLRKKR